MDNSPGSAEFGADLEHVVKLLQYGLLPSIVLREQSSRAFGGAFRPVDQSSYVVG